MLRTFKHTYSKFYKINSFVNHLFLDVVFRANKLSNDTFNSNLLLPKYRCFVNGINNTYVLDPIKECYKICRVLPQKDLKTLRKGVHNNSKIRELCNGNLEPLEYSDIEVISIELSKHLKTFFNYLYDEVVTKAPIYNNYEKIDDYYKKLVGRSLTCRCCGTNNILGQFHSKRSALDHYLPRKYYPFISINCNNLIPICDTCNSRYKLAKNTLYETTKDVKSKIVSKNRRKAFYPYSRNNHEIGIKVTFKTAYSDNIEPKNIDLDFECIGYEEQLETWDKLFGIKENYKAEYCSEDMRMHYEEQYMNSINYGLTHEEYISLLKSNLYGDKNFLKIGFLEGINN